MASPRHSGPTPRGVSRNDGSGFQRLVDLGAEHAVEILSRHRADQLERDFAVAADHEGFGYAIDAPFDRAAAVAVTADDVERIAVAAEETAGVVGRVLV